MTKLLLFLGSFFLLGCKTRSISSKEVSDHYIYSNHQCEENDLIRILNNFQGVDKSLKLDNGPSRVPGRDFYYTDKNFFDKNHIWVSLTCYRNNENKGLNPPIILSPDVIRLPPDNFDLSAKIWGLFEITIIEEKTTQCRSK